MKSIKRIMILMMISLSFTFMFSVVSPVDNNLTKVEAAVRLSRRSLTLTVGKKATLKLKGTKKKIKWTSNKKSVVTVNKKGVVKAKKAGKAVITAKVGKKSYKCKVTVKKTAVTYGTIKGTVLYHYNSNLGYFGDGGSTVYVLDGNKIVGQANVDVSGNYSIPHVPSGHYSVLILSGNQRTFNNSDEDQSYYLNTYGIFYTFEMKHTDYITVTKNSVVDVSWKFGYTEF